MKRRNIIIIIVISVIVVTGTGTGLGIYFWLNPLGVGNETLATGTVLSDGILVEIEFNHWGIGKVQIVQLEDDSLEVQFIDVEVANGPNLYVYLSNKTSFSGIYDDYGEIIDLGLLPYNEGKFAVSIPDGSNISDIHSVLIWCKQFSVVFTYASLI